MKTVFLDASRIMDRNAMYMYMNEIFRLPEYMGKSLDALHDALCEVQQDTEIICTHDCLEQINSSGYAFNKDPLDGISISSPLNTPFIVCGVVFIKAVLPIVNIVKFIPFVSSVSPVFQHTGHISPSIQPSPPHCVQVSTKSIFNSLISIFYIPFTFNIFYFIIALRTLTHWCI